VPTIGDESWGSETGFTDTVGSRTFSGVATIVISRKGQVLISESIARFGDTGAPDEAVRLTKLVVGRMN